MTLPGVILNGPIFLTASIISRQKAKGVLSSVALGRHINSEHYVPEALAASVVKVAGRDVLATWKILVSLGVAPLLYTFYAFLATIVAFRADVPMEWKILTPLIVLISLPFIGYAALKFGEAGMDVLKYVTSF